MKHGGEPHNYLIRISPESGFTAVRLDPGQRKGEIRISEIRLNDARGVAVQKWDFGANLKESKPRE